MEEAIDLARAIELDIIHTKIISLRKVDAGHLIGKGHIESLTELVKSEDIGLVYINFPLSPIQQRNLEKAFNAKVIDRTGLILEIFGARAQTREGVLQVQHAHLKYQKSRLVRSWTHLERQRGGSGFLGGPGETQIESDRRALDTQIIAIEGKIAEIKQTRGLHRAGRARNQTPVVALVGYTNAGKSTLFNVLSGAEVMAKDMLFATLDPTMRQVVLPNGQEIIFSDTVGFISDLPTELVVAFRATLEEVIHADLVLHVRDASNAEHKEQAADVYDVIEAIGIDLDAAQYPMIEVFNKTDLPEANDFIGENIDAVKISAITGKGLPELLELIQSTLKPIHECIKISIGYGYGDARAWAYEHGVVTGEGADENGFILDIEWDEQDKNRFIDRFGPIYTVISKN